MKVHVEVTREDILHGIPRTCGECPVARAIRRLFPDALVEVLDRHINVFRTESCFRAGTPPEVSDFIGEFDGESEDRENINPFGFDLELEEWDGDYS